MTSLPRVKIAVYLVSPEAMCVKPDAAGAWNLGLTPQHSWSVDPLRNLVQIDRGE